MMMYLELNSCYIILLVLCKKVNSSTGVKLHGQNKVQSSKSYYMGLSTRTKIDKRYISIKLTVYGLSSDTRATFCTYLAR